MTNPTGTANEGQKPAADQPRKHGPVIEALIRRQEAVLELSPTLDLLEKELAKGGGEFRTLVARREGGEAEMPPRCIGCRRCPEAKWSIETKTVIAYCKLEHRYTWAPGMTSSESEIATTLCDGVARAVLAEEAKRAAEGGTEQQAQ